MVFWHEISIAGVSAGKAKYHLLESMNGVSNLASTASKDDACVHVLVLSPAAHGNNRVCMGIDYVRGDALMVPMEDDGERRGGSVYYSIR